MKTAFLNKILSVIHVQNVEIIDDKGKVVEFDFKAYDSDIKGAQRRYLAEQRGDCRIWVTVAEPRQTPFLGCAAPASHYSARKLQMRLEKGLGLDALE